MFKRLKGGHTFILLYLYTFKRFGFSRIKDPFISIPIIFSPDQSQPVRVVVADTFALPK